jgi:hypothetical protein
MKKDELRKKYLEAAEGFRKLEKREDRTLLYLSVLRLLCFAAGLFIIILLFLDHNPVAGLSLTFATVILFLFLLKLYSDHSGRKEFYGNLAKINMNEANALSGDYSMFDPGNKYADHSHDFSYDVDLFGENSLFQYLNRTVTGYGRDILAGWLWDPYLLGTDVAKRQEILRELAIKKRWRHEFMASGMKVHLEKDSIAGLVKWMDEAPVFESSPGKKILIFLLPSIALISLGLLIAGVLHYSIFVFILLLNLAHVSAGLKMTNDIHRTISGRYSYLSSMNRLLKNFGNEPFSSSYLNEMKQEISGAEVSAAVAVKKLGRLIQSFDSRLNLLVGFGLNALLLWDFHCIRRLEKWKAEYRNRFPVWLGILGKVDAYSSLANYAFNNPGFIYPILSDSNIMISAGMLGHPLIDESRRVCNDFYLENRGNICIITGANMAGKSTFLRTVAVNYILGMTGSPVCASGMVFTPVRLFTSMRTTDSLSGNESYFYAELKRLRTLKAKIADNEPVFFILDEILKGTNSADKTLGSGLFIKKMINMGGTGLIATHDLSLGELEKEHPGKVFNMCFEIEIEGEAISFDYKLNRGMTKKMNAAFLMRQMGILD